MYYHERYTTSTVRRALLAHVQYLPSRKFHEILIWNLAVARNLWRNDDFLCLAIIWVRVRARGRSNRLHQLSVFYVDQY